MPPNVVWITLESVRADYASPGPSAVDATPNLQEIAEAPGGDWFDNCFTHAHWTPAATTSILTGTTPSSHRVGYVDAVDVAKLPDDLATVPGLLADRGYRSACFTGNGYLRAAGLERDFDRFDTVTKRDFLSLNGLSALADYLARSGHLGPGRSFDVARHLRDCFKEWYQVRELRRWMRRQAARDRPFFAYAHLNNSHHPYRPPSGVLERVLADSDLDPDGVLAESDAYSDDIWTLIAEGATLEVDRREAVLSAYEAEVRYADSLVGRVFEEVRSMDDTVLVVTADHGELFGEGGSFEHNLVLHDALLNVPLVVHGLDWSGVPEDALVQHVDVMQTLLSSVGADTSQFQGHDLTTTRREFALAERGPRYSDLEKCRDIDPEFDARRFHGPGVRCIRSTDWKYQRSDDRAELFRLPDEETDVASQFPGEARRLSDALDDRLPTERFESTERAEIDAEMEAHLRDMGYLD